MGIISWLFAKKKREFIKHAKIIFNDEWESVPIDNPLMKNIRIYLKSELIEEIPYSDVVIDELKKEGVPILNETLEPKQFITTGIELGKIDLG